MRNIHIESIIPSYTNSLGIGMQRMLTSEDLLYDSVRRLKSMELECLNQMKKFLGLEEVQ